MKILIDIDASDYKEICQTVMSIDEMDNTTHGRVYCAIVRGGMHNNKKYQNIEQEPIVTSLTISHDCIEAVLANGETASMPIDKLIDIFTSV